MKFIKKLLILLIVFTSINLIIPVYANSSNLEVFHFNFEEEIEAITIELYDTDNNYLNVLQKNEVFLNDAVWYRYYIEGYNFTNENYILKVTNINDGSNFNLDLTLNEGDLSNNTYTFYLKEKTLDKNMSNVKTVITYATFTSRKDIKFFSNFKVDESEINVLINDTYYEDFTFRRISNHNIITLSDDLDFQQEYYLNIVPIDGQPPSTTVVGFNEVYDEGFFVSSFAYQGDDLGATYTSSATTFKIWAPTLNNVTLNLYNERNIKESLQMTLDNYGVYTYTKKGNLKNYEYTFSFTRNGIRHEIIDPYVKFTSNTNKGVIIDFKETNPSGFENFKPQSLGNYNEAIIYESNVNQITKSLFEPHLHGKFNGLYENTRNIKISNKDYSTGLGHLKELGITHLALSDLLLTTDSLSVINPIYQTDKSIGSNIKELKRAIKELNDNGINVIFDLDIYNSYIASLEKLMPGYYYETNNNEVIVSDQNKSFFNTNRYMTNKYVCSQVLFLIDEFKFSGLKLSPLNGLNIDHINNLWRNIENLEENFILYGEFIEENPNITNGKLSYDKLDQVRQIGFIDEKRFDISNENFLTSTSSNSLKSYVLSSWSSTFNIIEPFQSFKMLPNYEDLDNNFNKQIKTIQLLSYGVPVIKAGEEINIFDNKHLSYAEKYFNNSTFTLYKNLIAFRKQHHSLNFKEHSTIKNNVIYEVDGNLVYYRIINSDDLYPDMIIVHNFGDAKMFMLPEGLPGKSHYNRDGDFNWQVAYDSLNSYPLKSEFDGNSEIELQKNQSVILHFGLNKDNIIFEPIPSPDIKYPVNILYYLIGAGGIVIIIGIGVTYLILNSLKKEED